MVEADIPWMAELASRRYPPEFDIKLAAIWVKDYVLKQPDIFFPIRTRDAFLVTMISITPWLPKDWEANVVMACAEEGKPWEMLRLIRASLFWAKKQGCAEWKWRTATEFDIGSMARRIGAVEMPPGYSVRL